MVVLQVQIFHSDDYPDKFSGNVNDILIENSSESFIDIQPTTYEAVVDVEDYPVERRGCLFDKESPSIFSSVYSQSNCIIGCRIESALALCRCIPFQMPLSNDNIVCTIEDIPCLNRFRSTTLLTILMQKINLVLQISGLRCHLMKLYGNICQENNTKRLFVLKNVTLSVVERITTFVLIRFPFLSTSKVAEIIAPL